MQHKKQDGQDQQLFRVPGYALRVKKSRAKGTGFKVEEADANKDNKITRDEHTERLKRAFMELDENHDGYISVNECRAYWVGKDQMK